MALVALLELLCEIGAVEVVFVEVDVEGRLLLPRVADVLSTASGAAYCVASREPGRFVIRGGVGTGGLEGGGISLFISSLLA